MTGDRSTRGVVRGALEADAGRCTSSSRADSINSIRPAAPLAIWPLGVLLRFLAATHPCLVFLAASLSLLGRAEAESAHLLDRDGDLLAGGMGGVRRPCQLFGQALAAFQLLLQLGRCEFRFDRGIA